VEKILGSQFLELIEQQNYPKIQVNNRNDLLKGLPPEVGLAFLSEDNFDLSIENNVINLPLRYQIQLKKIIEPDQQYQIKQFAIAEGQDVSASQMKLVEVTGWDFKKIDSWFNQVLT
jgi:hypothetical protein